MTSSLRLYKRNLKLILYILRYRNHFFESIAKDMGSVGSFFIRYTMQVAFIINVIYLFDIPHFFVRTCRWYYYRFKHRHHPSEALARFKDTWYFDLGYFQAYSLTLFFLSFMFAVIIPFMTIFTFILFLLRFYFDKYN